MRPWVIRFRCVGDMVLQSVLLHHLRRRDRWPCGLVTGGTWSSELFHAHPDVGLIRQLRWRHGPFWLNAGLWKLASELSSWHGPFYVSDDSSKQVDRARWLLEHAGVTADRCIFLVDHPSKAMHWVDRLNEFASLTPTAFEGTDAIDPRQEWFAPRLSLVDEDRRDVSGWLHQRGLMNRPLVLLQPGNRRTMRRWRSRQPDTEAWPVDSWAALAHQILGRMPECGIVLCGSKTEERMLAAILHQVGSARIALAAFDLPLRRLMALTEVAHSMISVDSGPAHIASAFGCPLVVLYGAEPIATWSRRSTYDAPIIELGGPPAHDSVSGIEVESVMNAWLFVASIKASFDPKCAGVKSSDDGFRWRAKRGYRDPPVRVIF